MRRFVCSFAAALVRSSALHAADNPPPPATIAAVSIDAGAGAVIVDGQLTERVWATATAATEFVQRDPAEGAAPSRPTEVKVAYDVSAIYVAVTAREPDGQRIKGLLTRRDEGSPSDWIRVLIDSYRDRRTAFEFAVNAAGVKQDTYWFNDNNEDTGWDAVWDVAVSRTPDSWQAEFKIPFSQLRFNPGSAGTFGFAVVRSIAHLNETTTWPLLAKTGDFDKAQIKGLVSKYFGSFKRGPDVPTITATPRVYMAWITPPFFKPGDSEADVTANILEGGDYSRLYKSLVYEKQLAQDVTAFQFSLALGSAFQIVATVRPGHTPDEVAAAIDEQLDAFRQGGPDQKEVERARNVFETQMLGGLEVMGGFGGVADTLNMFNHYVGDPGYLPKYLEEHRKITLAAVKAFAQTYLKKDARVVVYGVSGQPDFGPPVPTPKAQKAAAGAGAETVNADEAWRATQPKPAAARDVKLPVPSSFTLSNGLKVMYLERPGMPVVTASLVIGSGGDANPTGRSGLANFTAAMLNQGTASRNALTLANDIAQLGAHISASSSKDAITVSLQSLKANLPAAIDLLADVALRPSFPKEEVERQRRSRLAQLVAQRQDPQTVASTVTLATLYGTSHPYGYIELGNESAIRATVREDMEAFWKRTFVPGNAALIVSGAIAEKDLKPLVDKAFGAWPGPPAGEPQRPAAPGLGVVPPPPAAKFVVVDVAGAPQTDVAAATIGAAFSTPDHEAAEVMNAVLGGLFSSRINLNLREAHGYSYGASSQFLFRKTPGPFWIMSGVRTDVTAQAVQEILKEIDRIRSAPLTADELAMGKDSIMPALPGYFETNAETVSQFANIFVYGLDPDYYAKYSSRVGGVTADAALAAAKKYLVPEKTIVVLVGDRAKIGPPITALKLGAIEARKPDGTAAK